MQSAQGKPIIKHQNCFNSKSRSVFPKRGTQPPLGVTEQFSEGHNQRPSLGSFDVILHNPNVTIQGVSQLLKQSDWAQIQDFKWYHNDDYIYWRWKDNIL